eukprot:538-Eustigmatos_ZCMA.PRE.1
MVSSFALAVSVSVWVSAFELCIRDRAHSVFLSVPTMGDSHIVLPPPGLTVRVIAFVPSAAGG